MTAAPARRRAPWRRVRAVGRIGRSALRRFWRDDGDALAGYIAYSTFLSIFPFAIFATALVGRFVGPEDSDRLIDALFELAPEHIAQTLSPAIHGVTAGAQQGLLTLSGLGALWVASNAVEAIRVAFDRAYGVTRPRGFLSRRARSLGFVVLATATFTLLGLLVIVAPLAIALVERYLDVRIPFGLGVARHGLGLAVLLFFLFQINLLLPSQRPPRRRIWPGILVSATLWTLGAVGFSIYLAYAPSYTVTYGAFAGVIVTLLFFYLTGAAIIIGAEVNAALMAFRRPTARDDAP